MLRKVLEALQFWVPSTKSWQGCRAQTAPTCAMARASSTEAFKIVDLYILKKKNNIFFCCCFRMGKPAKGSPSLKCKKVSFLVPPAHPSLAGGRRSSLAREGVWSTLQQLTGAPGTWHGGRGWGQGLEHLHGVGLRMAWG